jgi:hypothetical protein
MRVGCLRGRLTKESILLKSRQNTDLLPSSKATILVKKSNMVKYPYHTYLGQNSKAMENLLWFNWLLTKICHSDFSSWFPKGTSPFLFSTTFDSVYRQKGHGQIKVKAMIKFCVYKLYG